MCQFTTIGARVDVAARDFGLAANLGSDYGLCMAAILLYQYESNCPKVFDEESSAASSDTPVCYGHKKISAKPLNQQCMSHIENEVQSLKEAQRFLLTMFTVYPVGTTGEAVEKNTTKIVGARTLLFSSTGKLLLRIGSNLYNQQKWLKTLARPFSPQERADVIEKMNLNDEFGKIEKKYREDLVATTAIEERSLRAPSYFTLAASKSASVPAPCQTPASRERIGVGVADTQDVSDRAPERKLAESALLRRLKIEVFMTTVGLRANAPLGEIVRAPRWGPAAATAAGAAEPAEATTPAGRKATDAADGVASEPSQKRARTSSKSIDPRLDSSEARKLIGQALESARNQVYLFSLRESGRAAHVRVSGMVKLPGATEPTNETFEFEVSPDDLIPGMEATEEAPGLETPCQWLEVEKAKHVLALYTPNDSVANQFYHGIGNYAAMAMHMMTADSNIAVKMYQMSENKKPLILQARSATRFAKGMLTLYPLGEVLAPPSRTPEKLVESKNASQNVDPCHLDRSWMQVRVAKQAPVGRPRLAAEGREPSAEERTFTIQSPLLKKQVANLSPFWAVSRCMRGSKDHNMELMEIEIHVPFLKPPAGNANLSKSLKPSAGLPTATVKVVVMTNSKVIEENQILCLPFYSDADR